MEKKIDFKLELQNAIRDLFNKYKTEDNIGDLTIASGNITDEALYITGDDYPKLDDLLEEEFFIAEEILEFAWKNDDVNVVTAFGVYTLEELSLDNLARCYTYLSYLEDGQQKDILNSC